MKKLIDNVVNSVQLYLGIQFSEKLCCVDLWISKARELLFAADVLEVEVNSYWANVKIEKGVVADSPKKPIIQGIYFMLIAYAIENIFKAILIYRRRGTLKNKYLIKIPGYIKSHDLLMLAQEIDMKLELSRASSRSAFTKFNMG